MRVRPRPAVVLCALLVLACATSASASSPAKDRPRISGQLYGLADGKPMLRFSVQWPSARIQWATLALPDGLTFNRRTVSRRILHNGRLTETFYKPGVTGFIAEVLVGQLRESKQLRRQINAGKVHVLVFRLWIKPGKGATRILPLKIHARKTGWSS
jgi:hypothetical protein